MDAKALSALRADPVDWRYKGFPPVGGVTVGRVGEQGWNLLAGDLPAPVMVLRRSAMLHNLSVMHRYVEGRGALLAPHGKTTMSPELFALQLGAGAWGLTAATIAQARVYRAFGVERILLANELVDPAAVRWVAAELDRDPVFDFYCLADSTGAVAAMTDALAGHRGRPLGVLVELGLHHGRTGARTTGQAIEVASAVSASPVLELAGVEGYEGVLHGDDEEALHRDVDAFLDLLGSLLSELGPGLTEPIVSAGGSAYFDRVCDRLSGVPARLVLRSGCYLSHDSGFYDHLSPLGGRAPEGQRLVPALEAWGSVLSRPEPDLALLLLGKRDVSHDIDLPFPARVSGRDGLREARGMQIVELNDQHAFLRLPADDPLAVGDLVGCGISHPCTAFDKWRLIPVVDDDYTVVDAVHTFF